MATELDDEMLDEGEDPQALAAADNLDILAPQTPTNAPAIAPGAAAPPPAAPAPQGEQWWIPKKPTESPASSAAREYQLISDLSKSAKNVDELSKGIQLAHRLEGLLGFEADRNAGVPVMSAFAKWGPKLFATAPAAYLNAIKGAQGQDFVPTTKNVNGINLVQTSKNQWRVVPPPAAEFKPSSMEVDGNTLLQTGPRHFTRVPPQKDAELEQESKILSRQAAALTHDVSNAATTAERSRLQLQLNAVNDQLRAIAQTKGTGNTHWQYNPTTRKMEKVPNQ